MKTKRSSEPKMKGMVEVTSRNRGSLEKRYGLEIPQDVAFILPPDILIEELNDPEFWEEERK